jgi:hypothetical protein
LLLVVGVRALSRRCSLSVGWSRVEAMPDALRDWYNEAWNLMDRTNPAHWPIVASERPAETAAPTDYADHFETPQATGRIQATVRDAPMPALDWDEPSDDSEVPPRG